MAGHVFHLSLVVPDLDAAKAFYTGVLGCPVGRDRGHWADIDFFGHQLTLHQASAERPALALDHFGATVDAPTWRHVGDRCRAHGVEFVLAPRAGGEDAAAGSASGKFVVRDPAGNLLEFKFTNGGVGPS